MIRVQVDSDDHEVVYIAGFCHDHDLAAIERLTPDQELSLGGVATLVPFHDLTHAVALGRLGGKKGGKARSEKLTPKERSRIAWRAAAARWGKDEFE